MIFSEGECKYLKCGFCTLHKRKCSTSLCIYKINDDLVESIKKTTQEVQE